MAGFQTKRPPRPFQGGFGGDDDGPAAKRPATNFNQAWQSFPVFFRSFFLQFTFPFCLLIFNLKATFGWIVVVTRDPVLKTFKLLRSSKPDLS
jgi:hypothetical protein